MVKKTAVDLSWIKIDQSGGVENHTINLIKPLNKNKLFFFVTPQIIKNNKYKWLKNCEIKILTNFYFLNIFYIFFFSYFFLRKKKINHFFFYEYILSNYKK